MMAMHQLLAWNLIAFIAHNMGRVSYSQSGLCKGQSLPAGRDVLKGVAGGHAFCMLSTFPQAPEEDFANPRGSEALRSFLIIHVHSGLHLHLIVIHSGFPPLPQNIQKVTADIIGFKVRVEGISASMKLGVFWITLQPTKDHKAGGRLGRKIGHSHHSGGSIWKMPGTGKSERNQIV